MALYPQLLLLGISGDSTPISIDMTRFDGVNEMTIELLSDYQMLRPAGMPTRPCYTGSTLNSLDSIRTIPNGTVMTLLLQEALALINAGGAQPIGGGGGSYVIDSGGDFVIDSSGDRITFSET